ncbi:MAG: hypothetical protein AB1599_08255, partial [Planctomycetota bacterium]
AFCKDFSIKATFIVDFDYLYKYKMKNLLNACEESGKDELKEVAKKYKNIAESNDEAERKKELKNIKDRFFEYWTANYKKDWSLEAIKNLVNAVKEENIYIVPFEDIKKINNYGNADELLKNILNEVLLNHGLKFRGQQETNYKL